MNEQDQVGTLVAGGAFHIISVLGRGGSGVTYEAERCSDGERVALKELSFAGLRDWKVLELFEREATILAGLKHPAIPPFFGIFRDETPGNVRVYIAQRLIRGQTLAGLVGSGKRFSNEDARALGIALLDVLVYLQSLRPPVFHRDIKPQNIVFDERGAPHLIDFGSARAIYQTVAHPGSTVAGTFGYMAPEQFSGQASPATDVHGLGATILFALTGQDPTEIPRKKLKPDLTHLTGVSPELVAWLERALEPAQEERFPSAAAALDALKNPGSIGKVSRTRALVRLGLLATFVFLLFKVGGMMGVRIPRPWRTVPKAEIAGELAPILAVGRHWSAVTEVRFSPDRKTLFTGSNDATSRQWSLTDGQQQGDFSGTSGRVTAILVGGQGDRIITAGGNTIRRWDAGEARTLSAGGATISGLVANASLSRGLCGRLDGQVQVLDLESGQEIRRLSGARGRIFAVARSEVQGAAIAAGEEGKIHVWREADGSEVQTLSHGAPVNALVLSQDGLTLASAGDDDCVRIWELKTGRLMLTLEGHENEVWRLALSPDGTTLASGGRDARVMLWNIHSGRLHRTFSAPGLVTALDFSLDGAWLAVGSTSQQAHLYRVSNAPSELPIKRPTVKPDAPHDGDAEQRRGWTPLHVAAYDGDLAAVKTALAAGVKVDARNRLGRTPLYNAAKAARLDVATFLLDQKADPNAGDEMNKTPLYVAVQANSLPIVELLLARGATPEVRTTFGSTLLHHAARHADLDLVKKVLPHCDLNSRENSGSTALLEATNRGHTRIADALLSTPGIQVDLRHPTGFTALILAVENNNAEMVRLLLQKGADPSLRDAAGLTPREIAERNGFAEVLAAFGSPQPAAGSHDLSEPLAPSNPREVCRGIRSPNPRSRWARGRDFQTKDASARPERG